MRRLRTRTHAISGIREKINRQLDKIKKIFLSYLPRLSAAAATHLMRRFLPSEEMEGRKEGGRLGGVLFHLGFCWLKVELVAWLSICWHS